MLIDSIQNTVAVVYPGGYKGVDNGFSCFDGKAGSDEPQILYLKITTLPYIINMNFHRHIIIKVGTKISNRVTGRNS